MTGPGRWERIERIFNDALARPAAEREAFVEREAAGDDELAGEVLSMLREDEADPDFLETPLVRMEGDAARLGDRAIGPYRLVRLLGRGGMGEVYLAMLEGEDFRRPVAVKVIRRGMDTDDVLWRFRTERRILASLRHPNIAQLLDGGATEDGRPYFVMEFVEGLPVDEYCRRHDLAAAARLALFRSICDAVQHAHGNLVLHRDIKPGNILVTPEGVPKLLDFGIGKLLDVEGTATEGRATRTGLRPLTPSYASPEQIRGELVTVASDVYQLGLLLFELLTGRRPLGEEEASLPERERAVLEEEPPRPSEAVAEQGVPPRALRGDLDTIVLMALRKEPERRYPSAAALGEDVERFLRGLPVRARPDTLAYRARKFVGRNALPLSAAAVVLVALAGATAYSVDQSRRVALERDRAVEVQGFLLEMFGASGPDQATGDTVTARDLLDRQAEALRTTYLDQPQLRAQMTAVLAEGYDRLGLLDEAEGLAEEALAIRRSALGPGHPELAASLGLLGWIRHRQGRSDEAESLLRESLAVARRARPPDPRGLSRTLNDLGVVREAGGSYDEAAALYREALDLRREHFGDAHRSVGVTASNLAVILYRKGEYEEAAEAGEEALAVMRRAVGPDHQRSIIIQGNLAAIRSSLGNLAGAEAEYRDLLERQTRLQGPDHPVTLGVMGALASNLESQTGMGKAAEAEAAYRDLLERLERVAGPEHPQVGVVLSRLAKVLTALGREDEALPLLDRSLTILVDAFGDGDLRVARTLEVLADAQAKAGRVEESVANGRRAVAIMEEVQGADNPETALVRLRYGHRLLIQRRDREALDSYRQAYEVLAEKMPEGHRSLGEALVRMAQLHGWMGNERAADSLLALGEEAIALGTADPATVELRDSLRAALAQGREGPR